MAYWSAAELGSLNVHKQVADEIQRFESVHPFIYRAYDLIGKISGKRSSGSKPLV